MSANIISYKAFLGLLLAAVIILFYLTYKKVVLIDVKRLRFVLRGTLIYITLPTILFVISLPINLPLRILMSGGLVYFFIKAFKNVAKHNVVVQEDCYHLRLDLILLFFGILIFSYAGLLWGHGFVYDWAKQRSMLLSLYSNPLNPTLSGFHLPLVSSLYNARIVYYYAMYLPAVYATRLLTLFLKINKTATLAQVLSFCFSFWNMLGLVSSSLLLPVVCKKIFKVKSNLTWGYFYLVMLVFSGLDYWCRVLSLNKFYVGHAEWAVPYFAAIHSFITHWQWLPNQLISGLLGLTLLCLYKERIRQFPLLLWSTFLISASAFCWMGFLPIALYLLYDQLGMEKGVVLGKKLKSYFKSIRVELVAAIFVALIVLLFYASRQYPVKFALNQSLMKETDLSRYVFFLLVKLLPVAIILFICFLKKRSIPGIVKLSVGILILLPLFQLGHVNDLVTKGSIPALLTVIVLSALVIQENIFDRSIIVKLLIIIFFIITIPAFINECIMGLKAKSQLKESISWIIEQYAGSKNR